MIPSSFYGTVAEGDTYFAARLHTKAWPSESPAEQTKALRHATVIIDQLSFKGNKASVCALSTGATLTEIRAAEAAQELEFPRGEDTVVPENIRKAVYELADTLLDGIDPELELENLASEELRFADVKTVYDRDNVPPEHIINGVPSATAWRFLKPFLRDGKALRLLRV